MRSTVHDTVDALIQVEDSADNAMGHALDAIMRCLVGGVGEY